MDIFCPHCQNHLAIEDHHAGEFVKCPLCSGMFTAPATILTGSAVPPPPVVPPQPSAAVPLNPADVFGLEPMPQEKVAAPMDVRPTSSPPVAPPQAVAPPAMSTLPAVSPLPQQAPPSTEPEPIPEPLPEGEYRRAFIVPFNPAVIAWIGPVCLGLIFVLSFFPWIAAIPAAGAIVTQNLWSLAFARGGVAGIFAPYVLFLLFGLILNFFALLLTKRIIVLPEPFKKVRPWRSLIVAGVVFLAFLLLFFHWIYSNFNAPVNFTTIWYKLAVRLHFWALVGLVLEYWLSRRDKKNLPLPKIELRW